MDRDELKRRLMATFLDEVEEHVRTLNDDLLAVEKAADAETRVDPLRSLFRTVHSLKSAARSVEVMPIEAICHHLEELLLPVRDGAGELGAELSALLFEAADALGDAAQRLRGEQPLTASPLSTLLGRVSRLRVHSVQTPVLRGPPALEADQLAPPRAPFIQASRAEAEPVATDSTRRLNEPRAPVPSASFVRVAPEKLDSLLAQGGELRVARQRGRSHAEDLDALRGFVATWEHAWRRTAARPLRQLLDGGRSGGASTSLPLPVARLMAGTRDNLQRLRRDFDRLLVEMNADARALDRAASDLEEELHTVRLLPFAEACQGLERQVRDLSQSMGKRAGLVLEGGAVEIDRAILQALRDPLLHLVRNAVDHGIEPPVERETAGKPAVGTVRVAARLRGDRVEVSVSDDGRGIDIDALRVRCRQKGIAVPENEHELVRLIFAPAVSTARMLTAVSGRGVGLDVVKSRVEALHGIVDVDFERGRGARFVLTLPLTLSSIRVLLVAAGAQTLAVPATNVVRLVRAATDELGSIEGHDVLLLPEGPLPAASLAEILGLTKGATPPRTMKVPMMVVAGAESRMALVVDELIGERDVVVKPLGPRLQGRRNLSGATILPSGEIALILNVGAIVRDALVRSRGSSLAAALAAPGPTKRTRVLVVDDSVTTRTLEKSILESSGFEVTTAADGYEAWELLKSRGADLVVSDVEMPRMDGFQLTETIRGSKRFRDLPVVLVTALESDQDKARGLDVGADAYLPKSVFDQRALLEVIRQLV